MNKKINLCFNAAVINEAKEYARSQGISLSQFTEKLLRKAISKDSKNIENIPIADWVYTVSEGKAEYIEPRDRSTLKREYFSTKS